MTALRRGWLLLLAALALSGCAASIDHDQARICRLVLPVLEADGAGVFVLRESAVSKGVRIDYEATDSAGRKRRRFAECRFLLLRLDLSTLTTDRGAFEDWRLLWLKRFWLATPEARFADPAAPARRQALRDLPFGLAYWTQQALNALPVMGTYALLAASTALVYGLVGRIVFGFGELAAAGGYAALFGMTLVQGATGAALLLALAFALWTTTLHGAVAARLVVAPLAGSGGRRVLVATFALAVVLQEYLRLTQGAALRWIPPVFAAPLPLFRSGDFTVTVTPVALFCAALALAAGVALVRLIETSRFGRQWRACADDALAAQLFGIDPRRLLVKIFALAAATSGLAGCLMTIFYGGLGYGASAALALKALVAAILGGLGSVRGAFLGGLLLGLAEAFWSAAFSNVWRDVAVFALLVLLLVFRPRGLFGLPGPDPARDDRRM